MTDSEFREKMESLSLRVGEKFGEIESGHERWRIYSRSVTVEEEWPCLRDLLRQEPDKSIASSVVLKLLEVLPESRRLDFAEILPTGKYRDYAIRRIRDLSVLSFYLKDESIKSGFDVESWSSWLQLRLASSVFNEPLLDRLSESGSTRRIRNIAKNRLSRIRLSG